MLIKTAFCLSYVFGCIAYDSFFGFTYLIWKFISMDMYFQVK